MSNDGESHTLKQNIDGLTRWPSIINGKGSLGFINPLHLKLMWLVHIELNREE